MTTTLYTNARVHAPGSLVTYEPSDPVEARRVRTREGADHLAGRVENAPVVAERATRKSVGRMAMKITNTTMAASRNPAM